MSHITYDVIIRRGNETLCEENANDRFPATILQGLFSSEKSVDFIESLVIQELEYGTFNGQEIWSLLAEACDHNYPDLADKLMKEFYSTKSGVERARVMAPPVLVLAAGRGMTKIVETLLQKGESPNQVDSQGRWPFGWAIYKGQLAVVKLLLKDRRTQPNGSEISDRTPLMLAIQGRHIDIITYLIGEPKVDINRKDHAGRTAMHHAIDCHMVNVCIRMIKKARPDGMTVLSYAAAGGLVKVVKALKERAEAKIIDINALCDVHGDTALHYAVGYADSVTVHYPHLANDAYDTIAAVLSIRGIDVNQCSRKGETALECAALRGNVPVIEALLKHEDIKVSNRVW
ncbi:Nuclear factor NF-kappa-B p105 subunit, partial [Elasticomyces elasticus]